MIINFYAKKNGRSPIVEFINKLSATDKAKILACLKSVEELGFNSSRAQFRQIRNQLWEIKIRSYSGAFRICSNKI